MLREKVIFSLIFISFGFCSGANSNWHYECIEGYCVKTLTNSTTTSPLSFAECNILCLDSAAVWPKPTGNISVKKLKEIDIAKISLTNSGKNSLLAQAFDIFIEDIKQLVPCSFFLHPKSKNPATVSIEVDISDHSVDRVTFGTAENYTIQSSLASGNIINVSVKAQTYFGARNALQTLTQLVVFDDLRSRILFPAKITVVDGPAYPWRGITLDTSRNFVTPRALKRTFRAMAASKLNTFHWHIVDSASFPYVSKSHPELSELGAYSSSKVYTDAIVRDLVEYARVRGIRVVPELDSPAHVGEGWDQSNVVTCFNWKPWGDYCAEPPCGQFDPSKPELYDILEDLYGDLLDQFGTDVFHMGGDEVNVNCWNNTDHLVSWMKEKGWGLTSNDFHSVWGYFQSEASKRLYKKAGKTIPIVLWSSDLTSLDNVEDILPPSDYIIQIWTDAQDTSIQTLLSKNYSLILSNYDALYLDCGFGSWVAAGNNWCSPYKGWQAVYNNTPSKIAGNRTNQIQGASATLWLEESGTESVDSRLWPRSAALAEVLWTDPSTEWEAAEERMLLHRERLASLGIKADTLQPEWCLRNQQHCPVTGKLNK